jgi:N-acetyl-gamma-glutamylphosphate reductase
MVIARAGADAKLRSLLLNHPRVDLLNEPAAEGVLEFGIGGKWRHVLQGDTKIDLFGLPELIDNNPLVCADDYSVPGPASTLALMALGPLIRADILVEAPVAILGFEVGPEDVWDQMTRCGWGGGVTIDIQHRDLGPVLAASFMAVVVTPASSSDIDDLYNEAFGRSFYARREEDAQWSSELVAGKPYACYRLRFAPDEPTSLLTIHVQADRNGKCGAAQMVHALNIMCGFEESLGITP